MKIYYFYSDSGLIWANCGAYSSALTGRSHDPHLGHTQQTTTLKPNVKTEPYVPKFGPDDAQVCIWSGAFKVTLKLPTIFGYQSIF